MIFAFDKGVIAEFGTHEELMQQKGIYFNLVQTQQSNTIKKKNKNKIEKKQKIDDFDDDLDSDSVESINESDEEEDDEEQSQKIEILPEDSASSLVLF